MCLTEWFPSWGGGRGGGSQLHHQPQHTAKKTKPTWGLDMRCVGTNPPRAAQVTGRRAQQGGRERARERDGWRGRKGGREGEKNRDRGKKTRPPRQKKFGNHWLNRSESDSGCPFICFLRFKAFAIFYYLLLLGNQCGRCKQRVRSSQISDRSDQPMRPLKDPIKVQASVTWQHPIA